MLLHILVASRKWILYLLSRFWFHFRTSFGTVYILLLLAINIKSASEQIPTLWWIPLKWIRMIILDTTYLDIRLCAHYTQMPHLQHKCLIVFLSRRWFKFNSGRPYKVKTFKGLKGSKWLSSKWLSSKWLSSKWLSSKWLSSKWLSSKWLSSKFF
jgi:hypothetical protein